MDGEDVYTLLVVELQIFFYRLMIILNERINKNQRPCTFSLFRNKHCPFIYTGVFIMQTIPNLFYLEQCLNTPNILKQSWL